MQPLYDVSRPHPKTWIAATIAVLVLLSLPSVLPPDGAQHAGHFLGRFHVAVVHFPIGLLLLAPVFDFASKRHPALRVAATWTSALAAVTAFVAAVLGIILAHAGAYENVTRHLWSGVVLAIVAILAAVVRSMLKQPAVLTLPLALLTVWTAHTGGAMVYGGNWLTEYAPKLAGASRNYPPVDPHGEFATKVQPILNANCVKCHGPSEHKANLRLDTYAHVMDGGASGDIISAGTPEHSILLHRITLPADDEKVMPKKGEKLSESDIATLRTWIEHGALPADPQTEKASR